MFRARQLPGLPTAAGSLVIFAAVTIGTIVGLTSHPHRGFQIRNQSLRGLWGNTITAATLIVIARPRAVRRDLIVASSTRAGFHGQCRVSGGDAGLTLGSPQNLYGGRVNLYAASTPGRETGVLTRPL
jgi:hypothetical protein